MEIYGADISGIEGELIRFRAVKEENRRGTTLLGLAQKVVKEGCVRAIKAIETLEGNWDVISNQGYTIDLHPAETQKNSSGLDLPIAIILLQASILQSEETLSETIKRLEKTLLNIKHKQSKQNKKESILNQIEILVKQRERILKYKKRIQDNNNKYLLIGSLDFTSGKIETPYYGMLGMISAAKKGFKVIVPEEAEIHAALVSKATVGTEFYKAVNLQEVWDLILGKVKPRKVQNKTTEIIKKKIHNYIPDLKAIEGVAKAKFAMEVAVAGGHNILLVGPPGHGKNMLSMAAIELLPQISFEEMFEVNKIYSAKGDLHGNEVVVSRPFQEANNNISIPALFGGGGRPPLPGLISLAHTGILFFDEINMCAPSLVENMRVPLSDKVYKVSRVYGTISFPCNFILVAAMNPCKCGWYGHYECPQCKTNFFSNKNKCPNHPEIKLQRKCTCPDSVVESYKNKLSKPLLDRIDLKILVSSYDDDSDYIFDYATVTIRSRIQKARKIQEQRYKHMANITCNGDIPDKSQFKDIDNAALNYGKTILKQLNIETKRTEVKMFLVARTIADLAESATIKEMHIDTALDLMGLTDTYFRNI